MNRLPLAGIIFIAAVVALVLAIVLAGHTATSPIALPSTTVTTSRSSQYMDGVPTVTSEDVGTYAEDAIAGSGVPLTGVGVVSNTVANTTQGDGYTDTTHDIEVQATVDGQTNYAYEVVLETVYANGTRTLTEEQGGADAWLMSTSMKPSPTIR
jgi:hypothetical protein